MGDGQERMAGDECLADRGEERADHQVLANLEEIVAGMVDRLGEPLPDRLLRIAMAVFVVVFVRMVMAMVVCVVMVMVM